MTEPGIDIKKEAEEIACRNPLGHKIDARDTDWQIRKIIALCERVRKEERHRLDGEVW